MISYGLRKQGKCVAALTANSDRNYFVFGTIGRNNRNEIHLIDFDEDDNIVSSAVFKHENELVHMSSHPDNQKQLLVIDQDALTGKRSLSLVEMQVELGGKLENKDCPLKNLGEATSLNPNNTSWLSNGFIVSDSNGFHEFSLRDSIKLKKSYFQGTNVFKTAVNPHSNTEIALIHGNTLQGIDCKSEKTIFTIPNGHFDQILDLDYNPNKQNQICTSGKDARIKIWDLRQINEPVMEISNHSHWITCVTYNKFHDQLLLSSGTDSLVNLYSIVSVSSTPTKPLSDFDNLEEDETNENYTTDGIVAAYDEHGDAVYQCSWSSADPWIFASVSFDGQVMINQVPSDHKYKIIL